MNQAKTYTLTETKTIIYAKEKAKKSLYLVLQKKPFSTEIIEQINEEVERRLTNFVKKLVKNVEERQSKNPELLLKYAILKAIVKILDDIMKENYIQMTEADKLAVEQIYGNEEDDCNDNSIKKRKNNMNNNPNQNNQPYYGPKPSINPLGIIPIFNP